VAFEDDALRALSSAQVEEMRATERDDERASRDERRLLNRVPRYSYQAAGVLRPAIRPDVDSPGQISPLLDPALEHGGFPIRSSCRVHLARLARDLRAHVVYGVATAVVFWALA
jgi:hypothetical protein